MPRTGSVNYHVTRPERQAFHIDPGGVVGKMISPELAATNVPVLDQRTGEAIVTFAEDCVGFATLPSEVTIFPQDGAWHPIYDSELTGLLDRELGAQEVVIFDHTVRIDDPNSDRKPARNVQSDYSPEGAEKRLIDLLGAEGASEWNRGHYAFVNIWRPVENPINSAPLGFIRPSTVRAEDWELIDLIYPDRRGHIMGLVASDRHEWIYRSRMTPEEVVYFNIYDNRELPSVGHSAIDMVEDASLSIPRKSIESRALIRY